MTDFLSQCADLEARMNPWPPADGRTLMIEIRSVITTELLDQLLDGLSRRIDEGDVMILTTPDGRTTATPVTHAGTNHMLENWKAAPGSWRIIYPEERGGIPLWVQMLTAAGAIVVALYLWARIFLNAGP